MVIAVFLTDRQAQQPCYTQSHSQDGNDHVLEDFDCSETK